MLNLWRFLVSAGTQAGFGRFAKQPRIRVMVDVPKIVDPRAEFVRKLARETGISEAQVRDLISMVGYDFSSIVREARILKQGEQ